MSDETVLKSIIGGFYSKNSGFVSVIALGLLINAAILVAGMTADSERVKEVTDAYNNQLSYEQTAKLENIANDVWLKYSNNIEVQRPARFLTSGYFVKFPKRDIYGRLMEEPVALAKPVN